MPPRKKKEVLPQEQEEPKKILQEVNINDLFECLKEFDNKVLLERLKVLERSVALLYKELNGTKAVLKEIAQSMNSLNLAYEELINSLGVVTEESMESDEVENTITKETEFVATKQAKAGKKWN